MLTNAFGWGQRSLFSLTARRPPLTIHEPEDAMPLLDHFHPPLHGPRRWEGFHHAWATFIAQQLNQETLPPDYFAESEISLGPELEIDVATMEMTRPGGTGRGRRNGRVVAAASEDGRQGGLCPPG